MRRPLIFHIPIFETDRTIDGHGYYRKGAERRGLVMVASASGSSQAPREQSFRPSFAPASQWVRSIFRIVHRVRGSC
jgi:hypothetical protein